MRRLSSSSGPIRTDAAPEEAEDTATTQKTTAVAQAKTPPAIHVMVRRGGGGGGVTWEAYAATGVEHWNPQPTLGSPTLGGGAAEPLRVGSAAHAGAGLRDARESGAHRGAQVQAE